MLKKPVIEIDKDEADEIVSEQRHTEVIAMFKKLLVQLSKEDKKDDTEIISAIEKQSKAIEGFAKAISSLKTEEKQEQSPVINIENNQAEIVSSIVEMEKSLKAILEENTKELKKYNQRPLIDNFEYVRQQGGYTSNIKVNYKK